MAQWLHNTVCPCAEAKDNFAVYEDGSGYCYTSGCRKYFRPGLLGDTSKRVKVRNMSSMELIPGGIHMELETRGVNKRTCEFFDYQVGEYKGEPAQIATFHKDGKVVGQKIKFPLKDKEGNIVYKEDGKPKSDYRCLGSINQFYGQWLFKRGKYLIVTEGEIDALSISQVNDLKYPVVSLPNGSDSAKKTFMEQKEWLSGFDEIILYFDADEPGQKAAKQIAMLMPDKVRIASVEGVKDANDALVAGKIAEMVRIPFTAKRYLPEGIVKPSDVRDRLFNPIEMGLSYPEALQPLTEWTYGFRTKQFIVIGAGTSTGKTEMMKELIHHLTTVHGKKVGVMFFEESVEDTIVSLAGKRIDKPLHLPDNGVPLEDRNKAIEDLLTDNKLVLYDHYGHMGWATIKETIRFMVVGEGCEYIFMDHMTALVTGDESGNEVKLLDKICTDIGGMVHQYDFTMIAVSHLNRSRDGKPHEEGGRVTVANLRGSQSIQQWASNIWLLERNQQEIGSNTVFRIGKNRIKGSNTGKTFQYKYEVPTARLRYVPHSTVEQPLEEYPNETPF